MNPSKVATLLTAGIVAMTGSSMDPGGQNRPPGRRRFIVTSVLVEDQVKALRFYTEILGFVKKRDLPVGEDRWLTVVSPDDPDGVELLLEPTINPAARPFQRALFEQGIPLTMFGVEDIRQGHRRLLDHGVVFRTEPAQAGRVTVAVLEDTCCNLIQLVQK